MNVVILHNIRSIHNVGSILRTCDGFGVDLVICSGYTPYPRLPGDSRLPHIADKLTREIHKTALGAESSLSIRACEDIMLELTRLKEQHIRIVGLEQSPNSIALPHYNSADAFALLLGEEVNGITPSLLELCDDVIEIPMKGTKESFNVSVAAGIALYQLSL